MTAKDLFGVAVRVFGLWLIAETLVALPLLLSTLFGPLKELVRLNLAGAFSGLLQLLVFILKPILGIYFLRGAPWVMSFAYPPPKDSKIESVG